MYPPSTNPIMSDSLSSIMILLPLTFENSQFFIGNFPTTNIEALACGSPVITYNTGGSPEAIDENTGIVIPKGDKEALKKAVVEVVSCKDKYCREICRKRAVENFNKDDRFGDYIELFNQALKTK